MRANNVGRMSTPPQVMAGGITDQPRGSDYLAALPPPPTATTTTSVPSATVDSVDVAEAFAIGVVIAAMVAVAIAVWVAVKYRRRKILPADVDPEAVTPLEMVAGKRGGVKQKWTFKVTQSEGLHTLFGPAFRGEAESGFVSLSPAGAMAFHPLAVLSVTQTKDYGAIPVLKLTVSSCCLTSAGRFRFTNPYMKAELQPWRAEVMRAVRDGIGLVLQGTKEERRSSLLTPAMRQMLWTLV